MTDTMTSQNIDLSSWDTLYMCVCVCVYIYIYTSEAVEGMSVETAAVVGIARSARVFCQLCWLIVEMEFFSSGLISFAF